MITLRWFGTSHNIERALREIFRNRSYTDFEIVKLRFPDNKCSDVNVYTPATNVQPTEVEYYCAKNFRANTILAITFNDAIRSKKLAPTDAKQYAQKFEHLGFKKVICAGSIQRSAELLADYIIEINKGC